jgi:hypothetical protein
MLILVVVVVVVLVVVAILVVMKIIMIHVIGEYLSTHKSNKRKKMTNIQNVKKKNHV